MYEKLANSLYGLYTGYAVTLFNLPLTIVVALAMSVVPAVAGAIARGDAASAQRSTAGAIKITVLFAVPCAIGMSVLAEPILLLVFQNGLAASMLQKLAVAIIFVSVLQVTSAVLQAYGRTVIPVVNMFIGGIVKVVINYNLVAVPGINIDGAPIGTLVCYFVIAVMNMYWIVRVTKCRFGIVDFLLKPLLAGGIMGAAAYFGYGLVRPWQQDCHRCHHRRRRGGLRRCAGVHPRAQARGLCHAPQGGQNSGLPGKTTLAIGEKRT